MGYKQMHIRLLAVRILIMLLAFFCCSVLAAEPPPEEAPPAAMAEGGAEGPPPVQIMAGFQQGVPKLPDASKTADFTVPEHGEVNLSGSYVFRYPFTLPPGRCELTPELSLTYDSSRLNENSTIGCGWNFDMPAIKRFNRYGVDQMYQRNDFRAPGGGEMLAVSTNGLVHEYRLRIEEEFIRYFYHKGYKVWFAYDRNGVKYTYGSADTGRISDGTNIFAWYLMEVRDPQGNFIRYAYQKDQGAVYPSAVYYTGYGTQDGAHTVSFTWTDRPDIITDWSAGFSVTWGKRLIRIESTSASAAASRYDLVYEAGLADRSRVQKITRVGADGVSTLPPVTFVYQNPLNEPVFNEKPAYELPVFLSERNINDLQSLPSDSGARFADINGDGLNDLLYARAQTGEKKVWINTGSGWQYSAEWSAALPVWFSSGSRRQPDPSGAAVMDLNGDHRADIIKGYSRTNKTSYINTGSNWVEDVRWKLPGELALRAYYVSSTGGHGVDYTGEGSAPQPDDWPTNFISLNLQFPDLNGDGRPDLVYATINGVGSSAGDRLVSDGATVPYGKQVWLNSETGWVQTANWQLPGNFMLLADLDRDSFDLPDDGCLRFADLNSDGLADLLYANGHDAGFEHDKTGVPGKTKHAWLNTGSGWQQDDRWILPEFTDSNISETLGCGDFLYFTQTHKEPDGDKPGSPFPVGMQLADLNGDGLTDIYLAHWYQEPFLGSQYDAVVNEGVSAYDSAVADCLRDCSGVTCEDCETCATFGWIWEACYTCGEMGCCWCADGSVACSSCDGSGDEWEYCYCCGDPDCSNCDGSGGWFIECSGCSGSGTEECSDCNGSGNCSSCGGEACVPVTCPSCDGNGQLCSVWNYCGDCDPGFSCNYYGADQAFMARAVWLNTGSGWVRQDGFFPSDMPAPMCTRASDTLITTAEYGNFSGKAFSDTGLLITDITGDGIPEFIVACKDQLNGTGGFVTNEVYSGLNGSEALCKKENGLGGGTLITYQNARQTAAFNSPQTFNVVESFTLYDGLGLSYTSRYAYAGGWHFNDTNGTRRSEFRGFHEVSVTDAEGVTKKTYYHQGGGSDGSGRGEYADHEAKKFQPYREEIYGTNGMLYAATLSKWDMASYASVKTNEPRAWPKKTDEIEFDFVPGSTAHREFAVHTVYNDSLGLPVAIKRYGEVSGNPSAGTYGSLTLGDDETYTFVDYATFAGKPYLVNRPSRERICSADSDSTSVRLSEKQHTYTSGGLFETEKIWRDTDNSFVTSRYIADHDTYGNPLEVHDAAGLVTEIIYDGVFHQYAETLDAAGHLTQAVYDPRSGQVISMTDPAGMTVSHSLDLFLRLSGVWKDGVWLKEYEYSLNGVGGGRSSNSVHTRVNAGAGQVADGYLYADGLGREIQTRAESERNDGSFRASSTVYDEKGRITAAYEPRFEPGGEFVPFTPLNPAVTYQYDALGRVVKMTPRTGDLGSPTAPTVTAYGYDNDPWVTVVTDALDIQHRFFRNANSQTVRVEEDVEGQTISTTYAYDRLKRLTTVFDPAANTIQIGYDSLGNKTQMTDPDMGTWAYGYDAAGRMTNQLDAIGNRIAINYDVHGRPLFKQVYRPGGALEDTVSFSYDSGASGFQVYDGQLYRVIQNGITNRFSYDAHGNILKTELQATGVGVYTASNSYDELDRPLVAAYPFSNATVSNRPAAVRYNYNAIGNLESVASANGAGSDGAELYKVSTFNELGQIEAVEYGNGVHSRYAYYQKSRRLRQSMTSLETGGAYQNLSYTFNPGGLITSINDHLRSGKKSATFNDIKYDNLNRLKSLRYSGDVVSKSYSYDPLGNIKKNDDYSLIKTYDYDPNRPHAVTSIGNDEFLYDANGGLTNALDREMTYDARGRLSKVVMTAKGLEVRYSYLDSGERLSKEVVNLSNHRTNLTVYLGKAYEEQRGADGQETLCHVFFKTKRVASFAPIPGGQQVASALPISDLRLANAELIASLGNRQSAIDNPWIRTFARNGMLIRYVTSLADTRLENFIIRLAGLLGTAALLAFLCGREVPVRRFKVKGVVGYGTQRKGAESAKLREGTGSSWSFAGLGDLRGFALNFSAKQVLCILFAMSFFFQPVCAQGTFQRGDVNGDGAVDMADALLIQQVVDGKRDLKNDWDMAPFTAGFANGDVNYDGATNATDVRIIMEYCAGLRTLPAAPVDGEGHEYSQRFTYYHDDHLGSTGIVTDRCGNIVQQITYTPYGEMRSELNLGASVNYLYTGQEFDREVGLYYYGARYYDQSIGRFISPDTVIPDAADSQSYNRYAYCLNNPIHFSDPTGHEPVAPKPQPPQPSPPAPKVEPPDVQPPTPVAATVDQIFVELGGVLPVSKPDPASVQKDKNDAAAVTAHVYGDGKTTLPSHISQVSEEQMKEKGLDSNDFNQKNGMAAGLYYNSRTKQYMLAFRGTEFTSFKDWCANFKQGAGFKSSQYRSAVELAEKVFSATEGNMMISGHSLGGGLASAASRATSASAITFNAAGLNSKYNNGSSSIQAYITRGEILNVVQKITPVPNAAGTHITQGAAHWYSDPISRHSISNHMR